MNMNVYVVLRTDSNGIIATTVASTPDKAHAIMEADHAEIMRNAYPKDEWTGFIGDGSASIRGPRGVYVLWNILTKEVK